MVAPRDLPSMLVFARLAEEQSISGAARKLGLSKSAVSKSLSRMEDMLGVRLVNRTTQKLSLTEAGRVYYLGCRDVMQAAERADHAVRELADVPRGRLRLNAPMTFGTLYLAPLLVEFMKLHPELEVDLSLEDRRVDLVAEGYDVALRITQMDDSSLIARKLCDMRPILCAAPSYLEEHGVPQHPRDLEGHEALIYTNSSSRHVWTFHHKDGQQTEEVRFSGRLSANNGEALLHAAIAGVGLVGNPEFISAEAVRQGRLVEVLPDWSIEMLPSLHVVYPARENLPLKVRVFVDFMVEKFKEKPSWED